MSGFSASETAPDVPRYERREKVGEGATAVVYRAWDRDLRRGVALKVLRDGAGMSELGRTRFRREAQTAAGLVHPNLVTVYDAGEAGGQLYIVMEIVEGRSLEDLMREGKATREELLRILEKAARGITAAHEKGVVHRDLKPANVLVTATGEPKVGDFGLAHLVDSESHVTRAGTALGTPLYMSPEQVEGKIAELSSRTDVYALGAMLFHVLAGRPPHTADTLAELYRKILMEEPTLPPETRRKVSRDLETVLLKALEKVPARRYPSAAAFADDLARVRTGEPIEARRAGLAYGLYKRVRRHRAAYAVGAAALGVLLAVGIAASRRLEREEARYRAERDRSVAMMRETARLSLEAALRLREKGENAAMRRYLPALEAAYQGARERAPELAEIEYLMGRMHRALMNDDRALVHQEEALRREPGYPRALYERAVLRAKKLRAPADGEEGPSPAEAEAVARDLSELLRRDPESAGLEEAALLTARGMLAQLRGQAPEARDLLERAVKRDPSLDEAWEALARLTAGQPLPSGQAEREMKWLEQEKAFTEALLRDRGFVPHLLGRATLRRTRGIDRANRGDDPITDYQAAEEDYSEALRLNKENVPGWHGRAMLRIMRGEYRSVRDQDPLPDFAAADKDLDELAKLAARQDYLWTWRSISALFRAGYLASRGKDAAADFDRAIRSAEEIFKAEIHDVAHKRRAIAFLHRGRYRMDRGDDPGPDFAQAEADLRDHVARNPRDSEGRMWRGVLEIHQGLWRAGRKEDPRPFYDAAEADLTKAIDLNRGYVRGHLWRGVARMERGTDYDGAQVEFTEALRLNRGFTEAWLRRGMLGIRRGDLDAAERDLSEALRLDPGFAEAWLQRGNARRARKGDDAAAEDYRAAVRINPTLQARIVPKGSR